MSFAPCGIPDSSVAAAMMRTVNPFLQPPPDAHHAGDSDRPIFWSLSKSDYRRESQIVGQSRKTDGFLDFWRRPFRFDAEEQGDRRGLAPCRRSRKRVFSGMSHARRVLGTMPAVNPVIPILLRSTGRVSSKLL